MGIIRLTAHPSWYADKDDVLTEEELLEQGLQYEQKAIGTFYCRVELLGASSWEARAQRDISSVLTCAASSCPRIAGFTRAGANAADCLRSGGCTTGSCRKSGDTEPSQMKVLISQKRLTRRPSAFLPQRLHLPWVTFTIRLLPSFSYPPEEMPSFGGAFRNQ